MVQLVNRTILHKTWVTSYIYLYHKFMLLQGHCSDDFGEIEYRLLPIDIPIHFLRIAQVSSRLYNAAYNTIPSTYAAINIPITVHPTPIGPQRSSKPLVTSQSANCRVRYVNRNAAYARI